MKFHIGVDLGGSKILVEALGARGDVLGSLLTATPRDDYGATIKTITDLVLEIERELAQTAPVGIGLPGSLLPGSQLVQNANSTWLNGQNFKTDISHALNRDVRVANDANCFALSEAIDGAAIGASCVFGVILGTGVGGGLVFDGKLINGPRSIGGEWGHCALPFCSAEEIATAPSCWCGRAGCLESWISGPALTGQYNKQAVNIVERAEEIVALAYQGDLVARDALDRHLDRVARGLAMVVNIFDPDVVVLGGGLSQMDHLYDRLPQLVQHYVFSDDEQPIDIRRPKFGATSGVRGAARLWPFSS